MVATLALTVTLISLLIWIGLLVGWGQFWRADQRLDAPPDQNWGKTSAPPKPATWPAVTVIIPARNEAAMLPQSLPTLLTQPYAGPLSIVLVDDQSNDGTADLARTLATAPTATAQLTVLSGQPLPPGWTGKLWAMQQGYRHLQSQPPDYVLFTDADIAHAPGSLEQLVGKAEADGLDLVSLMVRLRCQSPWETLLIPAFVFFFQMLYPFPWVNRPQHHTAAAAGGCVLLRWSALERIGGPECIRQALIDDCALGAAVKAGGPIWLGLSETTHSLRPYPTLQSIWEMVARTAYTQLHYSPGLLLGTVLGMALVYLVPPVAAVAGLLSGQLWIALAGFITWLLMGLAYWPTLHLYRCPPPLALALPLIGLLYTLMTVDSARRHWQGAGGAWKGRVYQRHQP